MTPPRFDGLARALATRLSRRGSLRSLLATGPAAVLIGGAAMRVDRVAAQDNDTNSSICAMKFDGEVAVGPDEGTTLAGTLRMQIARDGAIDGGAVETADGTQLAVVGQATGRALNLRVAVADGRWMTLTGTAAEDVVTCNSRIEGMLCGPQRRDLGTWTALPEG
jgi:hypothetical protein